MRSAWGLGNALRKSAPRILEQLRGAGFDGIEASLDDIGLTPAHRRDFVSAARNQVLEKKREGEARERDTEAKRDFLSAARNPRKTRHSNPIRAEGRQRLDRYVAEAWEERAYI